MGWIRRLFFRKRLEADLDKELRFHFEFQVAEKVRSGIPESEARRRTRMPKPCPFINTNLPLCSVIEHDRRSNRGAQVLDGHGAVHRPVAGILHGSDWPGRSCGRCTARGITRSRRCEFR